MQVLYHEIEQPYQADKGPPVDTSRFITLNYYIDSLAEKVTAIEQKAAQNPSDQPMIESVLTEVHAHLDDAIELCDLYLTPSPPDEFS